MREPRPAANAPTPLQTLILWALVARGGEAAQKDVRPALAKADRDALVQLGLLQSRKQGRSMVVELTDRGWGWTGANCAAPLSARAQAIPVLRDLLARVGAFLAARDVSLAEFIRPGPPATPPDASAADLSDRIRAAYLAATGGATKRRVRLADLEAGLPDVPRERLHPALLAMQADGGAGLLRHEDPTRITEADRAAVLSIGGEPRHFLWLD